MTRRKTDPAHKKKDGVYFSNEVRGLLTMRSLIIAFDFEVRSVPL